MIVTDHDLDTPDAIEIIDLERAFSEELKCDYEHTPDENFTCSVTVVARVVACDGDAYWCKNVLDKFNLLLRITVDPTCGVCEQPIETCWTIVPL